MMSFCRVGEIASLQHGNQEGKTWIYYHLILKKKKRVVKRNVETISGSCVTTHFWIGWDGFFMVGCPGRDAEEFTCASQSLHIQAVILLFGTKWESFSKIMPPPGVLQSLTLSLVPVQLFLLESWIVCAFATNAWPTYLPPFTFCIPSIYPYILQSW